MNFIKENSAIVALIALIIAVGGIVFSGSTGKKMGQIVDTSYFDWFDATTGYKINGTAIFDSSANLAAAGATLSGLLKTDAGTLRSYSVASSTVGTETLQVSDINAYDTIFLMPAGAAANKTLTFFASSTASTWLPTAGDMQETCFRNSTTTAAATITFAAGTGIDLETASSSPTDLTILAGETACFKFIRQPATASTFDISADMIEYTDAD